MTFRLLSGVIHICPFCNRPINYTLDNHRTHIDIRHPLSIACMASNASVGNIGVNYAYH